ncbi:YlmC/YmxH family sporulation protein [Guptibacillus hwajinpoensis]|uniref:YlmC/YmxH family sporulation protein n=1 Tax=Guptibacillus hwajinpoensis TaxID=208199 RepID=UPI001CFEFE7A|nr:YlmC/YmxH family sporulation protein [Pseudalkalibacillus hwajinpoensis]WLR59771.1 YlmC/YmxH family sporulation protein [Pseudalkalibacillus hwajinpoensis]
MRLSQLSGKELIDIEKGRKLGVLGQTDLLFDEKTGLLKELIIPKASWMGLKRKEQEITIPWERIETIGRDMIILQNHQKG